MRRLFRNLIPLLLPFLVAPAAAQRTNCVNGTAGQYECREIDLLGHLTVAEIDADFSQDDTTTIRLNDIWGWTDPQTGNEYALVGRIDGVSVVDISNPQNPVYVANLPKVETSQPATWRDVKVYENHAFIVADASKGNGLQVFDLTQVRNVDQPPVTFSEAANYNRFPSAHNLFINTETGFVYIVGIQGAQDIPDAYPNPQECGPGLHIVDVQEPSNPQFAGCFYDETSAGRIAPGYAHDVQCVVYQGPDPDYQGREICIGSNELDIIISDVTDKEQVTKISSDTYPTARYIHQGWLSEDHRYFFQDDELDEAGGAVQQTTTYIWDLQDLDNPELINTFEWPTTVIDHNLYVVDNLVFASNYESGLRIMDMSDIQNPEQVAFFDTYPQGNSIDFNGSWSNYPFFDSRVVAVSDITNGLFLLQPSAEILNRDSGPHIPETFAVTAASPNPFHGRTQFDVAVDRSQHVTARVYDVLGRQVAVLLDEQKAAGTYTLTFEADRLSSGVYFIQITGESERIVRQVLLVR